MYWRDSVALISTTETVNSIGDTIETETKKTVYANKMAYRTKAVTQALANGLRPQYSFEIKSAEYGGEERLEYDGVTYDIIDTAPAKNECIELVCKGVI